jgi:hypothetical protein
MAHLSTRRAAYHDVRTYTDWRGMVDHNDLLLAEYNNCSQLANHIDNVRNVITSFFLTINSGILIVMILVAKGELRDGVLGSPSSILIGLLLLVFTLGTLFTGTVARLRRIQSERYWIANRILDHFLRNENRLIVPLDTTHLSEDSGGTFGLDKRATGTYLWTLAIVLPTSSLAGLTAYLVVTGINGWAPAWLGWPTAAVAALIAFAAEDYLYFRMSTFVPTNGPRSASD